ncbi:DUF4235 domain-containing protein [Actinomycetaceae bacterium MB13-C1-2]|nr:DUF4235 domain-containing protein [Actinomycetaceae bacterium MB13-C1-2]
MNLVGKLASMGAVAASGFVASKIADKGWTRVTGKEPPKDDSNEGIVQVVVFAALSAIIAALVQRVVMKGTTRLLTATEGAEKPEMPEA